jgi:hypothetical protein
MGEKNQEKSALDDVSCFSAKQEKHRINTAMWSIALIIDRT